MMLKIQVLVWDRHNAVAGLTNDTKTCTDSLPPKNITITNMNDNINMDSTIAGSMNARS